MNELTYEQPSSQVPYSEIKLPIYTGNFVGDINAAANTYLARPTPLYLKNIVPDILRCYNDLEGQMEKGALSNSKVTPEEQTESFNDLLRAFNILWHESTGSPIHTRPGVFVASWLGMDKNRVRLDAKIFPNFDSYVTRYKEVLQDYFRRMDGPQTIYSLVHEIGEDTSEFAAVGKSERKKFTDVWQCNMVGIEQKHGKGVHADYGILHRGFETVID